jgi:hypothetical protein
MKICNVCNISKPETSFRQYSHAPKYRRNCCNDCRREKDRIRRETEGYKSPDKRTNKEKIERLNKWRKENPEKVKSAQEKWKEYNKKWKANNSEKVKESRKKYNQNPKTKITESVRRRIKKYMLIKNITKKNKTFEIVGCTPDELKLHLERLFVEGMSWNNYGFYGWHIDHKIPLSSANTEEELLSLCHFSNLQPLWAQDNLKKGTSF